MAAVLGQSITARGVNLVTLDPGAAVTQDQTACAKNEGVG
jgi:hypothetical protein